MSIHLEPGTVVEPPAVLLPALAETMRGRLATPADPDWDSARTAWNLAVDQHPVAVAFPADADDVAAVLGFASTHGLRVAPQSGGHNPGPLGDLSHTVLLRTTELREVTVDVERHTVRAGAGVLWGEVTAALAPHGLAALAGSSADVGVSGYLLGGGYSWFARWHGLAANHLRSAQIVTGDARVLTVSRDDEPELFWAVRGGGGNGLVVTALEFGVFPLTTVYAGSLLFEIDRAAEVCAVFADWTDELDESATVCLRLLRVPPLPDVPEFLRGKAFVGVDGAIAAEPQRAAELLAPIRRLGPAVDLFGPMPAAQLAAVHMDPPTPVPGAGQGLILDEMAPETIQALLSVAGPEADTALLAVDLRLLGGAVGRPVDGGGAVDHLPGKYLAFAVGITPTPPAHEAVRRDLRAFTEALAPWTNPKMYTNFDESTAGPERFHDAATLERLRAVQHRIDPFQVIRSNHPLH